MLSFIANIEIPVRLMGTHFVIDESPVPSHRIGRKWCREGHARGSGLFLETVLSVFWVGTGVYSRSDGQVDVPGK